jgi:hypothetical protein
MYYVIQMIGADLPLGLVLPDTTARWKSNVARKAEAKFVKGVFIGSVDCKGRSARRVVYEQVTIVSGDPQLRADLIDCYPREIDTAGVKFYDCRIQISFTELA